MNIKEIAKERGFVEGTIISHIEQIMNEYPTTIITHLRPVQSDIEMVQKANEKLKEEMKGKLTPLKFALEKLGNKMAFEDIRLARLFI